MTARPARLPRRALAVLAAVPLAAVVIAAGDGSSTAAPPPPPPPPAHIAAADAAATGAVAVSPFPGTPDASPSTQISFLGAKGMTVSAVKVTGSHSGAHSGKLERYSTGTGESFLPSARFTPGESVKVSARVTQGSRTTTVATNFTVGFDVASDQSQFPNKPGNGADVQHYLTQSFTPSSVQITTPAQPGATPGDFFLAPYQGTGTPGPMIVDQSGNLVWFHPLPPEDSASNFRVQRYGGKPVLTWWQGRILKLGFGQGEDEIYSTSYRPIAHVHAGNGYRADLHEFLLTPQGTAWIDAFDPVELDLTSMGGSAHEYVNDSIVQEIDVKTGLVMWEWHAMGHIAMKDSYSPIPHTTNWDWVHINSIDPGGPGVLLSSRNTWTIYDVDPHTGAILWRIGGKVSSFKIGAGASFYYQHDAQWLPGGQVSVFDNGSSPPHETQSRGLVLDPNPKTHTVTLVKAFTNPSATLLASSQGDLLSLPGGNWLMGYGGLPNFTEYDNAGRVLFDATLGPNVQDFRTYISAWSATPKAPPAVAAQVANGTVNVEASWNGATGVASWKVLAGSSPSSLSAVTTAPRHGFETTIAVHTSAPYVAVAALSASGATLASSPAIKPSS